MTYPGFAYSHIEMDPTVGRIFGRKMRLTVGFGFLCTYVLQLVALG